MRAAPAGPHPVWTSRDWRERVRMRLPAWGAAASGLAVAVVAAGFAPHLAKDGLTATSVAAVALFVGGLTFGVAGLAHATAGARWLTRVPIYAGVVVSTLVVASIVAPAVAATNVPHARVGASPAAVGLPFESAVVATADGVDLAAWHVASKNGAAVVLLHGAGSTRSSVLDHAAVLARNGYGVLLLDARGHGQSGGRAMDFGWRGDLDVAAAVDFLRDIAGIDAARIGLVGMSMGGEEAIGASAVLTDLRAVVAEGATGRVAADDGWLSSAYGVRGGMQEQLERVQDWITDLLTSASPPTGLRDAVASTETTRYLLISAGKVADEEHAAAYIAGAAPDRVDTWTVGGASHTDGLAVAGREWENRVVSFLDIALGKDQRP
jgi:pimeloyl-ACP methyl ester carboxylesterase